MSEASDKITQFENDIDLANQIVNGDDTTDVAVDSGPCPTFRKTMAEITTAGTGAVAQAQAAAATATSEADRAQAAADAAEAVTGINVATETVQGIIEIASESETTAGTDGTRAVPPLHLATLIASKTTASESFVLPASANEGETVNGTYAESTGVEIKWTIPTEITDFVYSNGNFSFTAPTVEADTDFNIDAYWVKNGFLASAVVSDTITILNLSVQDVTITINDADGYDVAPVDGVIAAPAYSVGVNNTNQIYSAEAEIVQTSGNLSIDTSSTASSLVTPDPVTEGDNLATDLGDVTVGTVTGGTTEITGGTIVAPNITNSSNAFDNDPSTKAYDGVTNEWPLEAGKEWTVPTMINEVIVKAPTTEGFSSTNLTTVPVVDIVLQGSNDGTNWDTIASKTNITNEVGAEVQIRATSIPSSYTNHRISISDPGGNGNGVVNSQVGEITFIQTEYTADISAAAFASVPTVAYVKQDPGFKIAEGVTDQTFVQDDYTLTPLSVTHTLTGSVLTAKSSTVGLTSDSSIKRIAMAVTGPDVEFNTGKLYIKEVV